MGWSRVSIRKNGRREVERNRPGSDYVRSSKSSIVRSLDFMVSAIGRNFKAYILKINDILALATGWMEALLTDKGKAKEEQVFSKKSRVLFLYFLNLRYLLDT